MFPQKSEPIIPPPTQRRERLERELIFAAYLFEKQKPMSVSTDPVDPGSKTVVLVANR